MSRRKLFWRGLVLLVVTATGLLGWWSCCRVTYDCVPVVAAGQSQTLKGGTDVTFLVAADTHIGFEGMEEASLRQIEAMNTISGQPWPKAIGGAIADPKALVIAGDLTDMGQESQWQSFVKLYGQKGGDGKLKIPVFLGTGNHDRISSLKPVLEGVIARHGTLVYSWDWGDLHLVMLDEFPTATIRQWLAEDLAAVGKTRPVILFMHFSLSGPFAEFWKGKDKDEFAATIQGYNIIGIFHGHYHATLHRRWRGFDDYNTGSPRHGENTFLVVRVTDSRLTVASWQWQQGTWYWWHDKPINAATATERARASGNVRDW